MILIIDICREKLHYFEFVRPIEKIIRKNFITKHYKEISKSDLEQCDKAIICGTSLKDNDFIENHSFFNWIKDFQKPLLGICAGFQLIGLMFGGKIKRKTEIGFYTENFKEEFIGLQDKQEVYHLHKNYIDLLHSNNFVIFSSSKIPQAVKHKEKPIYATLFHPEVRQKNLILNFLKIK
jgi:GMP synthase-like glutamine amidotransferase